VKDSQSRSSAQVFCRRPLFRRLLLFQWIARKFIYASWICDNFFSPGAGNCYQGVAEEPLRGCLNSKPWKHIPDPLKTGRGP
jgi:hypothetical protein